MKHRLYAMTYCDPLVDEGSRRCFELSVHICVGCSVRGGGAMCASSEDGVTALGRLQPAQLGRQDEVICDVCPVVRTVVCGVGEGRGAVRRRLSALGLAITAWAPAKGCHSGAALLALERGVRSVPWRVQPEGRGHFAHSGGFIFS